MFLIPKEKQKRKTDIVKLRVLSAIVFFVVVITYAWMCDDAYHGFVMVKHLNEGNGFVYNIGERVNAATNPLFILIVASVNCFFNKMYLSAMMVSVFFSMMAAVVMLYSFCRSRSQVAMAVVFLCMSESFATYTTSGLENCLLFFLSAVILLIILSNDLYDDIKQLALSLLFSAVAMTRLDCVLIYIPIMVYIFIFKGKNGLKRSISIGFAGLIPFFLWEIFSVFYYGLPFPNTAYIKLNTGISLLTYIERGFEYVIVTFLNDILVVSIPIMMIILCIKMNNKYRMLAMGILLYLLYLIRIGGDFMLGRHFTVIYFISCLIGFDLMNKGLLPERLVLKKYDIKPDLLTIVTLIAIISMVLSLSFGNRLLWRGVNETKAKIADERAYYYCETGLIPNIISFLNNHELLVSSVWDTAELDKIIEKGTLKGSVLDMAPGIVVYYHSNYYLQDRVGLGDPLLSHLPAKKVSERAFRVGHMIRDIPSGYKESVEEGRNCIEDKSLREYYDIILLITRGKLTDMNRIKAIIRLNMGKYDKLINNYMESR